MIYVRSPIAVYAQTRIEAVKLKLKVYKMLFLFTEYKDYCDYQIINSPSNNSATLSVTMPRLLQFIKNMFIVILEKLQEHRN